MHIYTGSFPHITSEGLGRRWEERREGGLGTEDPLVSLGSNSSCILKVQPTGFADGLDVGHERGRLESKITPEERERLKWED